MIKKKEISVCLMAMMFVLACFEMPAKPSALNSSGEDSSSAPLLTIVDSKISPLDGMTQVFVPAGEFIFGSYEDPINFGEPGAMYLDAFWIDQTEVTNAQYQKCVSAGACTPPDDISSFKIDHYYGNSQYDDFPVIHISWYQAQDYCSWAGRRLPSEAEWEKAARGTDGRKYPWGNESPRFEYLNFKGSLGDRSPVKGPTKVGSYPSGASPYGALDMAGNVQEWTADWFYDSIFKTPSHRILRDPSEVEIIVVRGGDWDTYDVVLQFSSRSSFEPTFSLGYIGFRCAQDEIGS